VYKWNTDAQTSQYKTGDDRHTQMEENILGSMIDSGLNTTGNLPLSNFITMRDNR